MRHGTNPLRLRYVSWKRQPRDPDLKVSMILSTMFDENELRRQFGRIGVYAVKMLYNLALSKRINMKSLVEHEIIPSPDQKPYYGLLPLTDDAFVRLLELGEVREGSVIY